MVVRLSALNSQENSLYSFMLEAESTPGPHAAGRTGKANGLIGSGTSDVPACSTVPQPTTLPRAPVIFTNILAIVKSAIKLIDN
jgi:hypothetical protein